jgi:hypothetical protein
VLKAVAIIYNQIVSCKGTADFLGAFTYFPDNQLVVVLSAERSQKLLVLGKVEILDEHFVQLEAVQHRHGVEVPDDDISLKV